MTQDIGLSPTLPSAASTHHTDTWDVTLQALTDRDSLEREWRALESVSNASFFLRWAWVGALLSSAESIDPPQVLRVRLGAQTRGMALLWTSRQRRHGFVRTRSLHLNETGRPAFDRITMEHNGVLAVSGEEEAVLRAAVRHLAASGDWDECYLSGLDERLAQQVDDEASRQRLWHTRRWTKAYHFVDLEAARERSNDYLDSLSANSRYQARRALKGYAALGPLDCRRAESVDEALHWFEDLMRLHQAHWTARGEPGAFSSAFTRRFHTAVITQGRPSGQVSLLRVAAGPELLGYLYNFESDGIASNYQSGHVAAQGNKLKPGLVVHCLAVQDALQRGLKAYDLLMGGDHFKPSLCNASGQMSWSVLQQRRLMLGIENRMRIARDRWRERRSAAVAPTTPAPPATPESAA